jgi:hypothetical protein
MDCVGIEKGIVCEALDDEILMFIDKHTDDGATRYEVQYFDDPECWTVPVLITAERAFRLKNDLSIRRIRFTLQSGINDYH